MQTFKSYVQAIGFETFKTFKTFRAFTTFKSSIRNNAMYYHIDVVVIFECSTDVQFVESTKCNTQT